MNEAERVDWITRLMIVASAIFVWSGLLQAF